MFVKRCCRAIVVASCVAVALAFPRAAAASPVGVELLLLVDVSGSIDSSEYMLQKQGYINAFQNPSIQGQIASIANGIAVGYAEWSSAASQSLLVNFTQLTDATSANNFANAIGATTRGSIGITAPGSAINWAVPLFGSNGFEEQPSGYRRVGRRPPEPRRQYRDGRRQCVRRRHHGQRPADSRHPAQSRRPGTSITSSRPAAVSSRWPTTSMISNARSQISSRARSRRPCRSRRRSRWLVSA